MKQIPNYTNYFATECGKIWSKRTEKFLKPFVHSKFGHLAVTLDRKHISVHRLILETFIGSCPDGMETRHLNGNPSDNRLKNLRWGTRSENQQDAARHGTHRHRDNTGSRNPMAKLTECDVKRILYFGLNKIITGYRLAKIYNIDCSVIYNILNRRRWKHVSTF